MKKYTENILGVSQRILSSAIAVTAFVGVFAAATPAKALTTVATTQNSSNFVATTSPEDQLAEIQRKLDELKKQKNNILSKLNAEKGSQNRINNQIAYAAAERDLIQNDVEANNLEIDELKTQEQIITSSIQSTEEVIKKTEVELVKLETEADKLLSQMYLDTITSNTGISLIFANGKTDIIKTGVYQQAVQEDTNSALTTLNDKNDKLQSDKTKLLDDQSKIVLNRQNVENKKTELVKKQGELQQKIAALNALRSAALRSVTDQQKLVDSLNDQEKALYAQYDEILKQIGDNTGSLPNGTPVSKGQIIGLQGKSGYAYGEHVHFVVYYNGVEKNPCQYLPSGMFGNCNGNGQLGWMLTPNFYFTSPYGPRPGIGTGFHHGADFSHPVDNAPVKASVSGYFQRTREVCPSWVPFCNGGAANVGKVCEHKDNCNVGFKTLYYHLK